jgi:5-methylcytosine-specific restriction endonuclease McrA
MSYNMNAYPPDWDEIALAIKQQAGWRCEHCGHLHDPASGYCLTVHHLDGDKSNCAFENLVALCQRCHLHIQGLWRPGQGWLFGAPVWAERRGYVSR